MLPSSDRLRSCLIGIALLYAAAATSCEEPDDFHDLASEGCRLEPEDCFGGAGGFCSEDRDCADPLFCCREQENCGGGMCTAECGDDRDCPEGMLCEHDKCFYACDDDRDCAADMTCEHDRTVCEYP